MSNLHPTPLESIEEVEEFYEAINRAHLTKALSPERPYTYWTIELYDKENGIRGAGGLGVLAADTRRVAEQLKVPLVLITPFYPSEQHQTYRIEGDFSDDAKQTWQENSTNGEYDKQTWHDFNNDTGFAKETWHYQNGAMHNPVNYADYGFNYVDTVYVKANNTLCPLDVVEKSFGSTRIVCVTEPGFGELYSGDSGGDHRLYQEIALGFGGYQALKLLGLKPAIMQLNEVATFFAALARLDELAANGMDFYEAVVYTRKHTLYTNHTLVQAAEAEFTLEQFERFVFPNLKSPAVAKWLRDKFEQGRIRLSSVTIEIAELRSGVSKLHARVANYHDLAGVKVKFKAVTNGIDIPTWTHPEVLKYLREKEILDKFYLPTADYLEKVNQIPAEDIRRLKAQARAGLNQLLQARVDQHGVAPEIPPDALIFEFKRRFADYKRPWLPFTNPERLKEILEKYNAYYLFAGRVHEGDHRMAARLSELLRLVDADAVLRRRVHYFPDYDEDLARGLAFGANASINIPIVGLEACGTSWMKDVVNFTTLISTHDGGVADGPVEAYLNVAGATEAEEVEALYRRMEEAAGAWGAGRDFDLEDLTRRQLGAFLPVISGARMMKDYLSYLF